LARSVQSKTSALVSLAILKVNWDTLQRGYIDNFVPMVAECVRATAVVSVGDVQSQLREKFGLNLPQNSIRLILRRAHRDGLLLEEKGVYKPNREAIEKLDFATRRVEVLKQIESVLARLAKFCAEKYQISWTTDQAESAFLSYLERYALSSRGQRKSWRVGHRGGEYSVGDLGTFKSALTGRPCLPRAAAAPSASAGRGAGGLHKPPRG
jgi:hypothetical protein